MGKHDRFSDDPALIEAELARERATLASTIQNLRTNLAADTLLDEATAVFMAKVKPMMKAVDAAVRANPVAVGMVAAGIAWLVLGRKSAAASTAAPLHAAIVRWEDAGGPVIDDDDRWIMETDDLRSRASAALAELDRAARAHVRPVADLARERAAIIADVASGSRAAMARGFESLSDAARGQIIAARERAYAARVAVVEKGSDLINQHPVVTGAIALAAGAALARSLPITAAEHRILGPERDRLFAEAKRLLQTERARIVSTAPRV